MTDYSELVKALQWCAKPIPCSKTECPRKNMDEDCACHVLQDAADAIEELQAAWIKSETDATNLTGRLAQAEADIERLSSEIDKRIATEIELSNQVDALQAEVERLEVDVEAAYALMEAQDADS